MPRATCHVCYENSPQGYCFHRLKNTYFHSSLAQLRSNGREPILVITKIRIFSYIFQLRRSRDSRSFQVRTLKSTQREGIARRPEGESQPSHLCIERIKCLPPIILSCSSKFWRVTMSCFGLSMPSLTLSDDSPMTMP